MRHLPCSIWDLSLRRVGFSLVVVHGLCSLWHAGSLVVAHGLRSCGARASLPRGMWDLSSPTRDRTCVPCIGRHILNHWTTSEVPGDSFLLATGHMYPVINPVIWLTGLRHKGLGKADISLLGTVFQTVLANVNSPFRYHLNITSSKTAQLQT